MGYNAGADDYKRKSQLAIEYSYRVREKSLDTWVFWVHASSYTRFEQGYRDIANRLKLHGSDDPKVDVLQLVSQWLQDDTNESWLLILDNADDANMFTYTVAQRRRDFSSTRFEIHSTDFEWLPACTQKLNRKKLLENTNL
jgi:hypothetical protein